jgi:hypothetical protein
MPTSALKALRMSYPEAFDNDNLRPGNHINPIIPLENILKMVEEHLEGKSLQYAKHYVSEILCDLLMFDGQAKSQVKKLLSNVTSKVSLAGNLEKAIEIFIQDR